MLMAMHRPEDDPCFRVKNPKHKLEGTPFMVISNCTTLVLPKWECCLFGKCF